MYASARYGSLYASVRCAVHLGCNAAMSFCVCNGLKVSSVEGADLYLLHVCIYIYVYVYVHKYIRIYIYIFIWLYLFA